ncbi:MAG: hypothetical protein QOE70_2638 [Chthoniobacter sp.]|jgi:hypothetical protein|nr:hypothetical protein [Chthoniobacter sp.]
MTALIVISNANTEGDYRAWSLYEMVPHPDGTATATADWTQLGRWELLPEGIIVDTCTLTPGDTVTVPQLPRLNYKGSPVTNYQYAVFLPNGSLLHSDPAYVRLVQGFRPAGATVPSYTGAKSEDGHPANYYDISIVAATGRVKLDHP